MRKIKMGVRDPELQTWETTEACRAVHMAPQSSMQRLLLSLRMAFSPGQYCPRVRGSGRDAAEGGDEGAGEDAY